MGSSRLPGKAMKLVMGKPLLGLLLERLGCCKMLDELVVATTENVEDDAIKEHCDIHHVACFRGSEEDVLGRLLSALKWRDTTTGVLVFGDCPLLDPAIVTLAVR